MRSIFTRSIRPLIKPIIKPICFTGALIPAWYFYNDVKKMRAKENEEIRNLTIGQIRNKLSARCTPDDYVNSAIKWTHITKTNTEKRSWWHDISNCGTTGLMLLDAIPEIFYNQSSPSDTAAIMNTSNEAQIVRKNSRDNTYNWFTIFNPLPFIDKMNKEGKDYMISVIIPQTRLWYVLPIFSVNIPGHMTTIWKNGDKYYILDSSHGTSTLLDNNNIREYSDVREILKIMVSMNHWIKPQVLDNDCDYALRSIYIYHPNMESYKGRPKFEFYCCPLTRKYKYPYRRSDGVASHNSSWYAHFYRDEFIYL